MSRFRRRLMGLSALRQAFKDDFVRVEYIENTSHTAYIDTKIIANQNTNYEIKVQFTKNTGYPYIFGSQYATKDRRFSLMEGSYNTFYYISNFHKQEINLSLTAEQQTANLTIKKDGLNIYIDDVKVGSFTNTTFTTPTSLTIFTCHFANGSIDTGHRFYGKLYYFKIYDGTTLVRDFIPMYQISTDTYGLWDRVNEEFYTSPNGVKFTGGERVIADADDNIYYLKDYVVARGYYSFANTGIKGISNDLLKMSLMVTSRPSTSYCWLIGYSSGENNRFGIYWRNSGSGYKWCVDFWRGSGYSNRRASTIYPNLNQRYDLIVGNPSTTQNNLSYMEDKRTNLVIFPEEEINPIGSNATYYVSEFRDTKGNYYVRWYNLEIYKTMGGKKELVLHWIPVQRCSDGVWGFFDKVKEDFHSSEGTEEFTGA